MCWCCLAILPSVPAAVSLMPHGHFGQLAAAYTGGHPRQPRYPTAQSARPLFSPLCRFSRAFDTLHTPRFYNGSVAITTLNTATPWLHRHGRIRPHALEAELAWLAQLPAHATRVLVAHHPFAVHRLHDYPSQLPDAPAALSRLAAAGVDVVLGACAYPFMCCVTQPAETGHALWVAQAGTALSSRAGMPNSVNRLLCYPTDKRRCWSSGTLSAGDLCVCRRRGWAGRGGLVVAG